MCQPMSDRESKTEKIIEIVKTKIDFFYHLWAWLGVRYLLKYL